MASETNNHLENDIDEDFIQERVKQAVVGFVFLTLATIAGLIAVYAPVFLKH